MKRHNLFLASAVLFSFLLGSCASSNNGNDKPSIPPIPTDSVRTLNIYGINDFHGAFSKTGTQQGLGRIGNFLKTQKEKDPHNTIIVSAGDMWQGGVESNKTKGNIITDAMNIIGFDAMAIGNHEFDWGEEAIIANQKMMNFPLLGSNIFYAKDNTRPSYLTPSTIVDKGGIKVGIIGAGSASLGSSILESISKNFVFEAPNKYIKEESDKLKKEGCDAVILVTHDGGFSSGNFDYGELTSAAEPYVDAVFLGHDHREKSGLNNGIPYVEGGSNGKFVSHVSIKLEKKNDKFEVIRRIGTYIPTMNNKQFESTCLEIDNLVEKYKDLIGDIDRVIYDFKKYYTKRDFLKIVCKSIYEYLEDNNNLYTQDVKATFHNSLRADVQKGKFTYRDLVKVNPFSNTIVIMKVDKITYGHLKGSYGNFISDKALTFTNGYEYIATINYISEKPEYNKTEKLDTGVFIQDAIEYHLLKNPGIY